jgi:tripartite-type tricarboxylate transporter receptor subunit TctC
MLIQAAVPNEIRDLLHREIVKVLKLPDVKARLEGLGLDVVANTQEEFASQIREEIPKWAKVILCQEGAKASCCTRDEGRSFGVVL